MPPRKGAQTLFVYTQGLVLITTNNNYKKVNDHTLINNLKLMY